MAATRYRRFLKLCEEWPVEETKRGRDLGAVVRQRVAQAFREGESTQHPFAEALWQSNSAQLTGFWSSVCGSAQGKIADPATCDQMYESLVRIHTNFYKNKYPRLKDTSFTGVTVEECKLVLASDTGKEMDEMKKGKWKKLREKFSVKNAEEDSK